MATSYPPSEYFNGIIYNPVFYETNIKDVTLAYVNANFLKSIGVALSTATITTFTGAVSISGLLSLTGGISLSGGITVDNLIVNGTSSFIGQSTFTSTINTSSIINTVSISSPNITASNILLVNQISNLSSSLPYTFSCGTVAIPSGINSSSGLQIGWNSNTGNGETDFTNLAQGGGGGFQFGIITNTLTYRSLCAMNPYSNQGFWLFSNCGRLRIDDRNGGAFWWGQSQEGSQMLCSVNGLSTSFTIGCGNASGVGSSCLTVNTTAVTITPPLNTSSTITSTGIISAPSFNATNSLGTTNLWGLQTGVANISGTLTTANITAQGTTTFNTSHPTTSLGNNISTNTTQYATVGYVNSNSASTLLTSNNIWTGLNSFTQNQISIGSGVSQIYVGNSIGNQQSIVIGDPTSLATSTVSTNCISVGTQSLRQSTGNNNLSFGTSNYTVLTTGSQNIAIGTSSGGGVTTGLNNIIIGTSSWTSGGNFSNCIIIGNAVPAPFASDSIILGSTETVYINGGSQLNNTLLIGLTVCSSNIFQVNNQIKRFESVYTTGIVNTILNPLPYMILFTPIAGMGFTLPVPSATNAGQTFIIRRFASGGGQSIAFTVTGALAVWIPINSGSPGTSLVISTIWQFTFYSNGTNYICVA